MSFEQPAGVQNDGPKTAAGRMVRHRYLLAILVSVAGVLAGSVVDQLTAGRVLFTTLLPAIIVSALYLGRGPAVVTLLICGASAAFFWLNPRHTPELSSSHEAVALAVFGCVGLLILYICDRSKNAERVAAAAIAADREKLIVLDNMNDGQVSLDPQFRITYLNTAALVCIGGASKDLDGRVLWQALPRIISTPFESVIRNAWTGQSTEMTEGPSLRDPHKLIELRARGHAGGVAIQIRDVTGRRLADQRIAHSESQLRLITDSLPVLVAYIDPQERYQFVNQTYATWFGVSRGQLLGKTIRDFIGEVTHQQLAPRIASALAGTVTRFEATLATAPGGRREVRSTYVPHRNSDGAVVGFMAMVEDITTEKATAARIAELNLELKRQVDEYATLLELVPVGIGIAYDRECRHIRANPALAASLGLPATKNVSKTAAADERPAGFKVLDADGREIPDADLPMQVAARDGTAIRDVELTIVHDDGRRVELLEYVAPLLDEHQRPRGAVGVFVDMTERRRAEDAVRLSEVRFRLMADFAPVLVWIADTTKSCFWFNKPWLHFVGRTLEQESGLGRLDGVHPEDRQRCYDTYSSSFDARQPFKMQYRLRRHDGQYRWVLDNGTPLFGSDGAFTGYIGSCVDVTEQKQSVDALRVLADTGRELSASLDLSATLRNAATLVVPRLADWCVVDMIGPAGSIDRVCVIHNDPEKAAWAEKLHERYPPDPNSDLGIVRVLRTGVIDYAFDITDEYLVATARDAEHLRIMRDLKLRSYIIVPLKARGRTAGALTLIYAESGRQHTPDDVLLAEEIGRRAGSAIENAELFEAERVARSEAERTSRLKDDFLATLSHELRTPLNAILGWSQLLERRGNEPDVLAEGLPAISRNAKAQTQLIEDLLDMSRIVSGKLRVDVHPLNLADVVDAAVQSIMPAARAKLIRIDTDYQSGVSPVLADATRLQQAVWNLLANAVKFTPQRGEVRVRLAGVDHRIEVSVSDNGQGIDSAFAPHLFTRFRQADASTTRRHGGLGIGLALVKQLVELHGGTVSASSPGMGLGSTFTITLPAYSQSRMTDDLTPAAHAGAEPSALLVARKADLTGLKVLVIDDDADARHIARVVLADHGAVVRVAGSAKEGFELLRRERPDVVLSDIGMPDHDGYEFIEWVRKLPPGEGGDVPAAALTAFARVADRSRALAAGYQAHLPKPLDWAELVQVVARLTGRNAAVTPETISTAKLDLPTSDGAMDQKA